MVSQPKELGGNCEGKKFTYEEPIGKHHMARIIARKMEPQKISD